MKRFSMILIAGLLLLGSAGNVELARSAETPKQPAGPRTALRGLDPIEFLAGKAVQGNKDISFEHNNLKYLFANEANRTKFRKDPLRYGIQGDGTCPVVPQVHASPNLALVYKERIYSFASLDCMSNFSKDPEKYLKSWPGNPDKAKPHGVE